ncbi:MAG: hypothetical protein WC444_00260 [Candidatus Paceibacterota bacterium]
MNQFTISPVPPLQIETVAKRHARILHVLYTSGPLARESIQSEVAKLFGKLYEIGGIEHPCSELARDNYIYRSDDERGHAVFEITDSGKEFLDEIGQWRPAHLGWSTSPNIKEEACA